jgi:hypothetical protein
MAILSTSTICDFASTRGNLLSIINGGISRIYVNAVPSILPIYVALVVEFEDLEISLPHEITISIDGLEANTATGSTAFQVLEEDLKLEVSEKFLVPFAIPLLGLLINEYGKHIIKIYVDDEFMRELAFWVIRPQ